MASNCKQTQQIKSTKDVNFKMRTSFSWDIAFFTNEGVLDDEELSNMIDGDGNDVNCQLEEINEIEAKLYEEIEASDQKSNMSSGKTDSQPKKSTAPRKAAAPTKPAPLSGDFGGKNGKSSATMTRKNMKTKTPTGISTKDKMSLVKSSTSDVNQQSKRGSCVPCRSVINNQILSSSPSISARKKDDHKTGKPRNVLILNTPSITSLKSKPPPVSSHPSSSTTQQSRRGLTKTGSPNGTTKARKIPPPKTVAGGSKPNSQKTSTNTTSKKQSSGKSKPFTKDDLVMSPEIMDLKGKLNALKM